MNAIDFQELLSAAASEKMAEAWRLYELGFRSAAAVTSRIAIEYAIRDRLEAAGVDRDRCPVKDRCHALQRTTGLSAANRKRIVDLFFDLSEFVHGRNRDVDGVEKLMRQTDDLVALIADC